MSIEWATLSFPTSFDMKSISSGIRIYIYVYMFVGSIGLGSPFPPFYPKVTSILSFVVFEFSLLVHVFLLGNWDH